KRTNLHEKYDYPRGMVACEVHPRRAFPSPLHPGVIVSFQQIDTVAADQAVASPMRRLGM
ncbi:MAG TPA: hypothetical protein PKY40_13085, partial [Burkholderiaceae bacterium]|nr:hypothetical protein [Burkholderiaceae bacterium]